PGRGVEGGGPPLRRGRARLARALDRVDQRLEPAQRHHPAAGRLLELVVVGASVGIRSRGFPHARKRLVDQSGYSSFRQARGSAGSGFGVRSSRKLKYGATNGSGADTV